MGLSEDVLPLQLPSHYGERRLKEFLKCQEIKVHNMDAAVHTVNPVSEYSGITQEPTDGVVLTEFQNSAVSHTILPSLNNISPTIHNFIQSTPFEITPASHTISLPVQATSRFIITAPQSKHESTMTQATYMESIKTITDNQVEQAENHSPLTEIKVNPGHPDVCLKRKLEHKNSVWELGVLGRRQKILAILAQRKRSGIQQYLVEWEGYTREEATWEPKRNIPEEIINSLWKI